MTAASTTQSHAGFFGTDQRTYLAGLGRAWKNYAAYRATLGALRDLTDRQLGDIGFDRATLTPIARVAAYRN